MKCEICGKEIEKSQYNCGIICSGECFTEYFWLSIIREYIEKPETFAIINGCSYRIGEENVPQSCKGFYGNPYTIEYFDGKIVKTTNLWTNGDIPSKYKLVLKDNARFKNPFEN